MPNALVLQVPQYSLALFRDPLGLYRRIIVIGAVHGVQSGLATGIQMERF
jgi:hypothetical protein